MKFAKINDISFLNEDVPTAWPDSHELNEQEEIINRKTFGEYLVFASGKSAVRTVIINGNAAFVTPFTHNSQAINDNAVAALNSNKIELISEQDFRAYLSGN